MVLKLKTYLKPGYILIAICLTVVLITAFLYVSRRGATTRASSPPFPVATMPAPVAASTKTVQPSEQDVRDNEHATRAQKPQALIDDQSVGRHPGVDISQISGSEEFLQEAPAAVDYPSPQPFQFVPDPERAVAGTGYAAPSSEHANEVYAIY